MKLVYDDLTYEAASAIREHVAVQMEDVGPVGSIEEAETFHCHLRDGCYMNVEVVNGDGAFIARAPALIGTKQDIQREAGTAFDAAHALIDALNEQC